MKAYVPFETFLRMFCQRQPRDRISSTSAGASSASRPWRSTSQRTCSAVTAIDVRSFADLHEVTRPLLLTNDSLIPADFRGVLRNPSSPFSLAVLSGTLAPGEAREVNISVYLDDAVKVTEELIVQVRDAGERSVALSAIGTGATIWCATPLDEIKFGEHFSQRLQEVLTQCCSRAMAQWCVVGIIASGSSIYQV